MWSDRSKSEFLFSVFVGINYLLLKYTNSGSSQSPQRTIAGKIILKYKIAFCQITFAYREKPGMEPFVEGRI